VRESNKIFCIRAGDREKSRQAEMRGLSASGFEGETFLSAIECDQFRMRPASFECDRFLISRSHSSSHAKYFAFDWYRTESWRHAQVS
jgi:hypothetical protein